jgi:hypothetical protein
MVRQHTIEITQETLMPRNGQTWLTQSSNKIQIAPNVALVQRKRTQNVGAYANVLGTLTSKTGTLIMKHFHNILKKAVLKFFIETRLECSMEL